MMDTEKGNRYEVLSDANPLLGGLVGVEDSHSLAFLCGRLRRHHALLFFSLALLFAAMLISLLVLAPLYADSHSHAPPCALPPLGASPPPPSPSSLSPAYDFPVWPAAPSWNISAAHPRAWRSGPLSAISWAHLDVSPDGRRLVFDVLGDLFLMPLDPATLLPAGPPALLLGGVPWAREPSFHPAASFAPGAPPEAQTVVFTCDASGLDNVWTLNIPSGALAQLTHETFRWVSSPRFSPDGLSVAAVKWLTSTRSLGAGELYLYPSAAPTPLDGGRLLLGISAPDAQLGPEEPFFTPADPSGLYYSQNVAEGTTFQYSQNVHQGLYAVFRRDLAANTSAQIVGGYGGSARPVVSHDGRTLALVRRVGYNTSLVLRDLASGNERLLPTPLETDMQDSYSPCGNYPAFAFSPDDAHLLLWARGALLRVSAADGAAVQLDLQGLEVALDLSEPLRFPVVVEEGRAFRTNATLAASAWAASATALTVAFTSVGRTHLAAFSPATGARLSQERPLLNASLSPPGRLEFSPSFSPDGAFLVHAVWTDALLGALELVALDPASSAVLSTSQLSAAPARYATPAVSPDGALLAYAVLPPGSLTGIRYPLGAGLFVMPLASRAPVLVSAAAYYPRWLNATHLTAMLGGYPRARLVAYEVSQDPASGALAVGPPTTLAWSKYATLISAAPDLAHFAFVEFGWVYLVQAPQRLPAEGLEVSSRPGHIPRGGVLMASPLGGIALEWRQPHWTDDDAPYLSFLIGAQMQQFQLSSVAGCWQTAVATNSSESPPSPSCVFSQVVSFDLSTEQATGAPAGDRLLCLTNATVVTMASRDAEEVIPRAEIQIRGETITAVLDLDSAPPAATCAAIATAADMTVDLQGSLVLPGFIDIHAHWDTGSAIMPKNSWEMLINLAYGVTTMHNPSATTEFVYAEAELVRAGVRLGPRTLSTGTVIYGAGGTLHQEIGSLETALQVLGRHKAYGCQTVKSYNQPQRYARQMILAAAAQLGMNVVPEGGMMPTWDLSMLVDSHTTIEHNIPILMKQDAISLWNFSQTALTPTLLVCYGDLWGEIWGYQHHSIFEDPRVTGFTPIMPLQAKTMRRLGANDADFYHFQVSRNVKELADAGVTVQIGAHGQQQGVGYTFELQFFQQGGQTPYQTLFAATKGGANSIGLQKVGEIKAGNLADLTVFPLETSPLLDVTNANTITHVVRGGRLFSTPTLAQLFPTVEDPPIPPVANTPSI